MKLDDPRDFQDEASFTQTVIELFRLNNWLVYHTHNSRHSERGFPDLVMVRSGVIIIAELKTDSGALTKGGMAGNKRTKRWRPGQEDWIREIDACAGVLCFLWRPRDWNFIERCAGQEITEGKTHTSRLVGK